MRIDLPTEVRASVFAHMQAERERIAKRYRAEGEEQALEIRAVSDKVRYLESPTYVPPADVAAVTAGE